MGSLPTHAHPRLDAFTRTLTGYQFVFFVIAAVVVAARLSGGGFVFGRLADDRTASPPFRVTPFRSTATATPVAPAALASPAPAPATPWAPPSLVAPPGGLLPLPTPDGASRPSPTTPPAPVAEDGGQVGEIFTFASVNDPGRPTAVAVGPAGDVWVGTDTTPGKVVHLDAAGAPSASHALPGVSGGIVALRLAGDGRLYALSTNPPAVFAVDPATGAAVRYSDDLPDIQRACVPRVVDQSPCDGSAADAKPLPTAMAFDGSGALVVADGAQGILWKVPPGGGAPAWWRVFPTWTHPSPLRPSGMSGLAFDGAQNLLVTVKSSLLDPEPIGKVFVLPADDQVFVELAKTGTGSAPAGIAIAASGNVYVTLAGTGQMLVLGRDGAERRRVPADATTMTAPVGIAFRGQSLLVAAQGSNKVFRLPTGERGGRLWS